MYFDPEKQLKFFELINELGTIKIMYQTTGLIIPPVHGVFQGANSPNDELPIDLVDLFSAFHDETYINGPSLQGDYEYISRLSQNFTRMSEEEKPYARLGIVYFSTMGNLVSKMFGDSSFNIPDTSSPLPSPLPNVSSSVINTNQTIFHILNPDLSIEEHTSFKEEFMKSLEIAKIENGIGSSISSSFRTKVLAKEFGNILVELT